MQRDLQGHRGLQFISSHKADIPILRHGLQWTILGGPLCRLNAYFFVVLALFMTRDTTRSTLPMAFPKIVPTARPT